jgi:hypothetical protein
MDTATKPSTMGRSAVAGVEKHRTAHGQESKREAVEAFIGKHSVMCLGAAIVAGAVLGWFIKRR